MSSSVLTISFLCLLPISVPAPRCLSPARKTELDTQVLCPAFNIEFLFLVGLEALTALGVNVRKIPRM